MALILKTQKEADSIVNNLIKASTVNIKHLNVIAYKFISGALRFIANHDIFGYIGHYGVASNLGTHILMHKDINQWHNFNSNHEDYEYLIQKKEIYNLICDGINKWREDSGWNKLKDKTYEIRIRFTSKERDSVSAYAEAMRHNFMDIPGSKIEINEVPGRFRELVKQNKILMDINYKEFSISDVLKSYRYRCTDQDSCDYEYSDYKAYLNLPIEKTH